MLNQLQNESKRRRTFAIISHPDAGKTTLTERLLFVAGAIQIAGTVKARKSSRHATSDWMGIEQQRGISVTSSVMQFEHGKQVINLLDTPGHEDFSEDTYRTLTAVDSALMVIDAAKGVEERTIKLMEICRLRATPIITFVNKLDREGRDPLDLLDEIERVLKMRCTPVTWPIGSGQRFRGIYHLLKDEVLLYKSRSMADADGPKVVQGLSNPLLKDTLGPQYDELVESVEFLRGAGEAYDGEQFLAAKLTPVYFGSALNDFGVIELLDGFAAEAPAPRPYQTISREVSPEEDKFTGFVFKIQANMDPAHRDRIAFMRVCSGRFSKGMKLQHVRLGREIQVNTALNFMAGDREHAETAWPGDILGVHNHGTIQIGDTFTQGEHLQFIGIPHFAPELFKRVILRDPLKLKALQKGLTQLSEEGATQVFRPLDRNDLILGAVGALQFDVVAWRLRDEYNVECRFENVSVTAARWIECKDPAALRKFRDKCHEYLALDGSETLAYLAPSRVNLQLAMERHPEISFFDTREH